MCERRIVRPDDYVLPEVWEACVEKIFEHAECVELSGLGEPTLEPLFPSRARTIADLGKPLYFPTNGAALGRSSVLDSLRDNGDTRVSLSIDAATAETYGKVRVDRKGRAGNWDRLLSNLKAFRKEKPNAIMTSCFVAGAYNIDEFPEFVQFAIDQGFNNVAFRPVRCWDISVEQNSLRYRKARTEKALAKAFELAAQNSFQINAEIPVYADEFENSGEIPGFIHYLDVIPLDLMECPTGSGTTAGGSGSSRVTETLPAGELSVGGPEIGVFKAPSRPRQSRVTTKEVMQILTDGTVTSCGAKHPIGHVLTQTFDEIIENPRYQSHLRARYEGQPLMSPYCRSCEKMF